MSDAMKDPNPWHPMTDSVALKHIGKLGEEASELATACLRCIIQGVEEREPVTGKINREWLEDEIADVLANISLVVPYFDLDLARIGKREAMKREHLSKWHKLA